VDFYRECVGFRCAGYAFRFYDHGDGSCSLRFVYRHFESVEKFDVDMADPGGIDKVGVFIKKRLSDGKASYSNP
jgi:hypothetical protein